MNRKVALSIAFLVMAAMLATTFSCAQATKPTSVTGVWTFSATNIIDQKFVADGSTEFLTVSDTVTLVGSITGTGTSARSLTIHNIGPNFWVTSESQFTISASFDGKEGALFIKSVGNSQNSPDGQWRIISGTGDLSSLRGQGTFSHISPVAFSYEGQVHFDPNL
jgi:hypothetical protein